MAARLKKKAVSVPGDIREATEYLKKIGDKEREAEKIESELNTAIEKLKTEAEKKVKVLSEEINESGEGLFIFAQANRESLTDDFKKKTVQVSSGDFGWRKERDSVEIVDNNKDAAIAELKKKNLQYLIRIEEHVNKEEILKDPEVAKKLKCLTVNEGTESFFIKPAEVKLELVKGARKFKRSK